MKELIADIVKKIGSLREFSGREVLDDIRNLINQFFTEVECADVLYTSNIDNSPFGVVVTPQFKSETINNILMHDAPIRVMKYLVEIDSKLFDRGLSDEEIAAMLIYNINTLTADSTPVEHLRETVDSYFTTYGTQLHIRSSIKYQNLLEFGLVDTLIKYTNCLYLDEAVSDDAYLDSLGLGNLLRSAINKIHMIYEGMQSTTLGHPCLVIIDWCFRLYNNVDTERLPAIYQLQSSKAITASVLYKRLIDKAIDSLYKIDTDGFVTESAKVYGQIFNEGKRGGLFAQIKYNGLRGIEDDLYEFIVRARNAETEEDVMYALKQINARLAILDDYIREENLPDDEKQRWTTVYMKYREIRDDIANKKVYNRKNYGVFFDYNQLDKMYDGDY